MADPEHRRGRGGRSLTSRCGSTAASSSGRSTTSRADAGPETEALFTVTAPNAPDGGLVLPAGKTTHLYLTSNDVIHAFYVPQFLFKRDVVPGLINDFDLTLEADDADQVFRGQCAELCGTGHRIMTFDVGRDDARRTSRPGTTRSSPRPRRARRRRRAVSRADPAGRGRS